MPFHVDWFRYFPCPCGKGNYKVVHEVDDWDRSRESWEMLCPACKETHVLQTINQDGIVKPVKWVPKDAKPDVPAGT